MGPRSVTRRFVQIRRDTGCGLSPSSPGSEVSPTRGVESDITPVPSGSMMNRPGAEYTM